MYRIEWAENPLASKVFLTERGRYFLRYKIALDGILDAAVLINMDKTMDPPKSGKWVDVFDYTYEDGQAERRVEELAAQCEHWLSTEVHCGDCTCVPCACIRCYAEDFLGISTIAGLGKHPGRYVQEAFRGICSLSNAIQYLLTRPIQATWGKPEDWQQHVPRWTEERNAAVAWLQQYGKEHNFIAVAE